MPWPSKKTCEEAHCFDAQRSRSAGAKQRAKARCEAVRCIALLGVLVVVDNVFVECLSYQAPQRSSLDHPDPVKSSRACRKNSFSDTESRTALFSVDWKVLGNPVCI